MEQFNLDKWLKDKSRKVVTRDGRATRIICWYAKSSKPIVALILTRSISQGQFYELTVSYFNDGTYYGGAQDDFLDLFFADEEVELTEFESKLADLLIYNHPMDIESAKSIAKRKSEQLLYLVRKEILKDIPKWKNGNDGELLYETSIVWIHNETKTLATAGLRMDSNTFYIPISELEKLPKEE